MGINRKAFSQKVFNRNDEPARRALKAFFPYKDGDKEYTVIDNPDKYAGDLCLLENGKFIGIIEVEVKHAWTGKDYPYKDVRYW